MRGEVESVAAATSRIVYCVIPRDLARKLHEPLRRHFRDDRSVEVVVERRESERRVTDDRRTAVAKSWPAGKERRRVRNPAGRRTGERRAQLVAVAPPSLPRRATAHAARLLFLERVAHDPGLAEDLDTARLVARFQAGDRDAFAELYLRFFGRLYGYMTAVLKNSSEAEDAAQHVFERVFRALPDYDPRRGPFRSWLFTIAHNRAVSHLRELARVDLTDPAELDRRRAECQQDGELAALSWISDSDLMVLVERLPLAQRQVLLLRMAFDLTHKEIAEILGCSPANVRQLQSRATSFVRQRLIALGRAPHRGAARSRRRVPQLQVLRSRRFALSP